MRHRPHFSSPIIDIDTCTIVICTCILSQALEKQEHTEKSVCLKNSIHTQLSVALFTYIPSLAVTLEFKSLSLTGTNIDTHTLLTQTQYSSALKQHFC